jgi:4-hydroxythreonine-4-phosphate dehydrogenase
LKPLAITLGDPAGIGTEVVLRAIASRQFSRPLHLFGSWRFTRDTAERLGLPLPPVESEEGAAIRFTDSGDGGAHALEFGQVRPEFGRAALDAIEAALDAIERGECGGMVTAPIQKESIVASGSDFHGHTELLAARAGLTTYGRDFAMYFDSPQLRVALLSVHIPLRDAIERVSQSSVFELSLLVDREAGRLIGRRPRIAVAGLNPHGGEGGLFGSEESEIRRGVERAAGAGLAISGPHSPDTVFHAACNGRFDLVVAMYHDQGLIPVKTLAFEQSVNVTLGLPWLRCSVDHGTAFDIAGKGTADPAPMAYAIDWADRHLERMSR